MTTKLSLIVSEFETQEQADSYDRWFRDKVQTALDDPHPGIPHDDSNGKAGRETELEGKAYNGLNYTRSIQGRKNGDNPRSAAKIQRGPSGVLRRPSEYSLSPK